MARAGIFRPGDDPISGANRQRSREMSPSFTPSQLETAELNLIDDQQPGPNLFERFVTPAPAGGGLLDKTFTALQDEENFEKTGSDTPTGDVFRQLAQSVKENPELSQALATQFADFINRSARGRVAEAEAATSGIIKAPIPERSIERGPLGAPDLGTTLAQVDLIKQAKERRDKEIGLHRDLSGQQQDIADEIAMRAGRARARREEGA